MRCWIVGIVIVVGTTLYAQSSDPKQQPSGKEASKPTKEPSKPVKEAPKVFTEDDLAGAKWNSSDADAPKAESSVKTTPKALEPSAPAKEPKVFTESDLRRLKQKDSDPSDETRGSARPASTREAPKAAEQAPSKEPKVFTEDDLKKAKGVSSFSSNVTAEEGKLAPEQPSYGRLGEGSSIERRHESTPDPEARVERLEKEKEEFEKAAATHPKIDGPNQILVQGNKILFENPDDIARRRLQKEIDDAKKEESGK